MHLHWLAGKAASSEKKIKVVKPNDDRVLSGRSGCGGGKEEESRRRRLGVHKPGTSALRAPIPAVDGSAGTTTTKATMHNNRHLQV